VGPCTLIRFRRNILDLSHVLATVDAARVPQNVWNDCRGDTDPWELTLKEPHKFFRVGGKPVLLVLRIVGCLVRVHFPALSAADRTHLMSKRVVGCSPMATMT